MKIPNKNNLIKGFAWLFSGAGLKIFIQIGSMIILARILTPEDFGLFAGAMAIMSIATVMATAGLTPSLVSSESYSNEFVKAAIAISLFACISIGFIIFLVSDLISYYFLDERLSQILKMMCIVFPFIGLKSVASGLCQRKFKFKQIAFINFSSFLLGSCICAIVLAYNGYGYYSLVIGFIINQILSAVAFLLYQRIDFSPSLRFGYIKEIFQYSKWYVSGLLVNNLVSQVDNVLVGKSFGAAGLGLYSRGYQFLIAPAILIGGIVDKVLFPLISEKKREQQKNTFEFFIASYLTVLIVGSLLSIFCFFYIEYFVIYGLGKQWVTAVPIFQWLSLCIPYKAAQKILIFNFLILQ
jgi:O-antigen/teichoic acid export membrane protein